MFHSLPRYAGCGLIVLSLVLCVVAGRHTTASAYAPTTKTAAPAADSDDESRLAAFRKAAEAERTQNYTAAANALRSLPRSSQDYLWNERLAWVQYSAKDYRNAQKQFEAAIRQNGDSFEPRTGLLLTLIAQERYADVEKPARQVLMHDADNYYANLRLTYVSRLQLKLTQANRINQRMLVLYPSDSNFLIEQALAYATQRRYDEARPYYQKVLLVSPDNSIANQALSIAQGTRARDVSSEAFRKAYNLEVEGKYSDAIAALSSVQTNKSLEYFTNIRLGWLNYLAGNQTESRTRYENAARHSPRAVEPLVGLLLPQLAQEKYADAEQTAKQAVQLDSLNYYARLRLGYVLRKQGKHAEAEKNNDMLLRRYPSDISLLLEQALTLEALQRRDEAVRFYRQVQLLTPDNATAAGGLHPPKGPVEEK